MKNTVKKMVMLTAFVLSASYAMSVVNVGVTESTAEMGCDSGNKDQQVIGKKIPCIKSDGSPGTQCCATCENAAAPNCASAFLECN